MDDSTHAGSVDDIYIGLEKSTVPCQDTLSQDNNSSLQNSQISDNENEDDDALVIDAQDEPEPANSIPTPMEDTLKLPEDDFDAFETGEWRLPPEPSTGALSENLDRIRDLAKAVAKENQEAKEASEQLKSLDLEASGEQQNDERLEVPQSNCDDNADNSDESSVAVNLEGDTDLEDEQPIQSEQAEQDQQEPTSLPPGKKEEEALNALNNVLDILCKNKNHNNENQLDEQPKVSCSKDLYDNLEELSSGESSLQNDDGSDSENIHELLEAASEVSSKEDELLKRSEVLEADSTENKENGSISKKNECEVRDAGEAKTNGTTVKLKRNTGLEEGEISESGSEVSRKIRHLRRRRRNRGRGRPQGPIQRSMSPLSVRLSGDSSSDYSPVKAPLVVDRNVIRKVVLSPSPVREETTLSASTTASAWKKPNTSAKNRNYRQSGNEATSTNHLETTLTVVASSASNKKKRPDREVYKVRKKRSSNSSRSPARNRSPVSRSPVGRNRSPLSRSPVGRNRSPLSRSPVGRNRSPLNRSPVGRNRSPFSRSPVGRNRSPLSRSPVIRSPVGRNRSPPSRSPVGRNRSPVSRKRSSPPFSRRRSTSRTKRRKRSISNERDSGRSRSPKKRLRSRSPAEKRKKNKLSKRSSEKRIKKKAKKKNKSRKKSKNNERSHSPSRSSSVQRVEKKSSERRRHSSESRSRSRSLYLSGRDSVPSAQGDNRRSPERKRKKNRQQLNKKKSNERPTDVVVIDLSQDTGSEHDSPQKTRTENKDIAKEDPSKASKNKTQAAEKSDNFIMNVNFKKKKLQNIFGDDYTDDEIDNAEKKDTQPEAKASPVKKSSPTAKGPQTPPPMEDAEAYDPCQPLGDDSITSTPTIDEPDQARVSGMCSPEKASPAALTSTSGKPTVAVLPIVDNKSPKSKDKLKSPVTTPAQPPLPPPQSKEKPPSPPPKLAPPPVPSFLFDQPSVQHQYIVMNPFLVNPYTSMMMPMQAATAPVVATSASLSQVSLTAATASRETTTQEGSPYSPGESPLFNDPITPPTPLSAEDNGAKELFDHISAVTRSKKREKKKQKVVVKTAGQLLAEAAGDDKDKERYVKMDETQMKILDDLPSSAVELQVKEKYLQKLHRQERVIEEVKLALKPFYNKKQVSKEDYKVIMKKCVPKICHNKNGEINPSKIKALVEGYVKRYRHLGRKHKAQAAASTS